MADVPFPPPLDEGLPEEIHSEHVLGLSQTNINVNDSDVKVEVAYHSYIYHIIKYQAIPYLQCHIIPCIKHTSHTYHAISYLPQKHTIPVSFSLVVYFNQYHNQQSNIS